MKIHVVARFPAVACRVKKQYYLCAVIDVPFHL